METEKERQIASLKRWITDQHPGLNEDIVNQLVRLTVDSIGRPNLKDSGATRRSSR